MRKEVEEAQLTYSGDKRDQGPPNNNLHLLERNGRDDEVADATAKTKPHAAVYDIQIELQEKLLHHECGVALLLRRIQISFPADFQDAPKQSHDSPTAHGSSTLRGSLDQITCRGPF